MRASCKNVTRTSSNMFGLSPIFDQYVSFNCLMGRQYRQVNDIVLSFLCNHWQHIHVRLCVVCVPFSFSAESIDQLSPFTKTPLTFKMPVLLKNKNLSQQCFVVGRNALADGDHQPLKRNLFFFLADDDVMMATTHTQRSRHTNTRRLFHRMLRAHSESTRNQLALNWPAA